MAKCLQWTKKLMRKKVPSDEDLDRTQLRRCLNVVELIGLGIGNTLGAGVFVLSGQVARESAGPAVVLSFFIAGVTASLAGLCYAEFAARVPRAGSAYVYSYVTVGEFMAFVIGWNILLEYIISVGAAARGISAYVDGLWENRMQEVFRHYLPISLPPLGSYPDFFALALVLLVTVVTAVGVKESTRVSNVLCVVTLLTLLTAIIAGAFSARLHNWQLTGNELPATGAGNGGFFPFGISGVIAGSATCFFAFVGFDFLASMSEEAEDSRRSIPMSMGVTLLVNMGLYCSVSAVVTLMVPYFTLDLKAPVSFAFAQVGWEPAKYVVSVGALAGMSSCLIGATFPMARVVYAMASDGLIFRFLSAVSPRFRTPLIGTAVSGGIAGVMALLFDLNQLVDMLSVGTLLAFALVAVCVLILRYETDNLSEMSPDTQSERSGSAPCPFRFIHLIKPISETPTKSSARTAKLLIAVMCGCMLTWPAVVVADGEGSLGVGVAVAAIFGMLGVVTLFFISRQPQNPVHLPVKVPLVPVLPALSCQLNIYLITKLHVLTWLRLAIWLVIGFCVYFFYGFWHSSLHTPGEEHKALIGAERKGACQDLQTPLSLSNLSNGNTTLDTVNCNRVSNSDKYDKRLDAEAESVH